MENILFIDIETVPQYHDYSRLPDSWKELWNKKAASISKNEEETPEVLYDRAGIYAEFGRIVCISCGFMKIVNGKEQFRLKSFASTDEKQLLSDFAEMIVRFFSKDAQRFCGHNAKEFDFPYISRRMIINNINLPAVFNMSGKKPWETPYLDTMELWKFGDFKSYTSLNLLAAALGIPTPKDDIDGSQVKTVYYDENNLERIATYCQKDVLTTARIYRRLNGLSDIPDEAVVFS
ncbi:MAG: 3'-5' exonuclease [Bacteroidia bacterium]